VFEKSLRAAFGFSYGVTALVFRNRLFDFKLFAGMKRKSSNGPGASRASVGNGDTANCRTGVLIAVSSSLLSAMRIGVEQRGGSLSTNIACDALSSDEYEEYPESEKFSSDSRSISSSEFSAHSMSSII